MPSKRKAVPTAAAPKCRTRICCSHYHPGDDESQAPLLNSTPFRALADVGTSTLEARQKDFVWQLTQCKAAVQENTRQLKNINRLLHELAHCLGVATTSTFPNSLPPQHNLPSRWSWVDPSFLTDIANGVFDIYNLPNLNRDECFRQRHIANTVEGVVYPFLGKKPHVAHAKTRLQSSIKDIKALLSAWMVYVSIRTFYAPEHGPSMAIWTERIAFQATL